MATVPQIAFQRNAVRPLECFKGGWNLIKNQYWLILGMCIVGWMVAAAVPLGILMGPMMCGIYLTFFKMRRGEPIEFGTMFKGFDYLGQSIVATLLHVIPILLIVVPAYILFYVFFFVAMVAQGGREPNGLAMLAVFAVFALFWIVVIAVIMFISIGFMFVYPLIVDRGLQGLDAVKLSFRGALANFWGLLGMVGLNFLLSIAGVLLCFVGVYFVLPISYSAIAIAYEQVFGLRQDPLPVNTPPPPPVFT
ncbi:MAG TPA: hypothetical protein VFO99_18495 [Pyrinomonadaceae bacterium]|nr:hypothetical protein [Pyrinomonadaceae bacterium]